MEIWKDVVGYEQYFMISNTGRIFSKRTNKEIVATIGKTGYAMFTTKIGGRTGKSIAFKVHRLVAESFIDNVDDKPYVNHIDGVKTNNTVQNLEWCTAKENVNHAIKTGLHVIKFGEDHGSTKLNEEIVRKVRSLYATGLYSYADIAKEMNLKTRTVAGIVRRETWKHI